MPFQNVSPQRQHIGTLEVHPQVTIRVAIPEILHLILVPAKENAFSLVNQERWTCICRHRIERPVPCVNMRRFSQMLGGLPVRDDSGASHSIHALPSVWSQCQCVFTTYLRGAGLILSSAARAFPVIC